MHDKESQGQHPAARRYGVFSIPTMILVGRDGKVLSTRARGEELNEMLKKQFAAVEKDTVEKDTVAKDAAEKDQADSP